MANVSLSLEKIRQAVRHRLGGPLASKTGAALASGAVWTTVGAVTQRGLNLLSAILVARILGKQAYGEFSMIQSTYLIFQSVAGFGLGRTATKFIAEYRSSDSAKAGRILGLTWATAIVTGGLSALLLIAFAPFLAEVSLGDPSQRWLLYAGVIVLFLGAMDAEQTGALVGFESFKQAARANVSSGVITFPLVVGATYAFGVKGAVIATALAAFVRWGINRNTIHGELRKYDIAVDWRNSWSERQILWQFALPTGLATFVLGIANWGTRSILVQQPGGFSELGVYNAALQLQGLVVLLSSYICQPLTPLLVRDHQNERLQRVNVLLPWLMGIVVSIPIMLSPEIFMILFGKHFSGRTFGLTTVFVACTTCLILYGQGLARALVARGLMWWGFVSNTIWSVLVVVTTLGFARYGAVGFAGAVTLSYFGHTLISVPLYLRQNVGSRQTVFSGPALVCWLTIVGAAIPYFLGWSLWLRLAAIPPLLAIALVTLRKMLHASTAGTAKTQESPSELNEG